MDLSYILNSPDVERVATALESAAAALETIEDKTVDAINGKIDIQQSTASAGKVLMVGSDGRVGFGEPGVPSAVATALLQCFKHVAWLDDGTPYYNALVAALESGDVEPIDPTDFDYGVYEPEELVADKYIDADGVIQDGEAGASYYIADFIPVIARSYWIALQPSGMRVNGSLYKDATQVWSESNWRISEYDANKNFIKQTQPSQGGDIGAYSSLIVTFASNTKYIRLGWYDNKKAGHVFEIENPLTFTELPMELGNIDASTGVNATLSLRIRTTGFIPVSGNTVTLTGCPFAENWRAFSDPNNPDTQTSVYGFRCYDANKNYIGILNNMHDPVTDVSDMPLPNGTAYIRLIMQFNPAASFSEFKYLVNHLFTINGVKYYVTGE